MKPCQEDAKSRSPVTLRQLGSRDLDVVTRVHCAAFPASVLTTLGNHAVQKYYEWQMRGPHSILALGAIIDGELAGFSFVVSHSELSGFLRRNARFLIWATIRHPSLMRHARFLGRVRQGLSSIAADLLPSDGGEAEPGIVRLLAIAVHPLYRRLGVGTALLEATETAAKGCGSQQIGLSVHPDNTGAVAFYLSNGWHRLPSDLTWSGEMRKRFGSCPSAHRPFFGEQEVRRIRTEYSRRRSEVGDLYSWARSANQFLYYQIYRRAIDALSSRGKFPLDGLRVTDIGCGSGSWLLEFCQWGAQPCDLAGIDLDESRIQESRRRLPDADLVCGDAEHMPWSDGSMDVVCQFTMMTSILDVDVKRRVASEMLRILKPGGLILWYDFHIDNPRNPSVRGIGAKEIRDLFPNCGVTLQSLTLAPPVARAVVPRSWIGALMLEKIPLLRTHYMGIISRNSQ